MNSKLPPHPSPLSAGRVTMLLLTPTARLRRMLKKQDDGSLTHRMHDKPVINYHRTNGKGTVFLSNGIQVE